MTYTITVSEEEKKQGFLHPNTLKMAKHLFEVHGFLKIDNVFPREFIENLSNVYHNSLHADLEAGTLKEGAQASHRRYIVPIAFEGPFTSPTLYANPFILPLMQQLLGPYFILNTLGAISALPGCTDQHLHADYFPLFEEDPNLSNKTPAFAITFGVPLVDVDLLNGPTQVFAGSHHTYPIDKNMQGYPKHYIHGRMGCCYFWDYRTFHAGGSNHSDQIRSLLYMAYTRRWFRDFSNPDYLRIRKKDYEAIPPEHKRLFAHMEREMQPPLTLCASP